VGSGHPRTIGFAAPAGETNRMAMAASTRITDEEIFFLNLMLHLLGSKKFRMQND
jgi:hypothetical protein